MKLDKKNENEKEKDATGHVSGQTLLAGSASPALVRGVSESLTGRVALVDVPGFSLAEVGEG